MTTALPHPRTPPIPWLDTRWLDVEARAYVAACTAELGGPTAVGVDRCGTSVSDRRPRSRR